MESSVFLSIGGTYMDPYFRVNNLAPKDGQLSVFYKKVGEKKSDGFAFIENGEIYIIDSGLKDDLGLLDFLLSLREAWLSDRPELIASENARLEIHIIVSHPHADHIGAMPAILSDPRICVLSLRAPMRSWRSGNVPEAIGRLVQFEDSLEALPALLETFRHGTTKIQRLPFGEKVSFPLGNQGTQITLYPAPYDWSEDRPSEREGFRFLINDPHGSYGSNRELSYANGILNGNSLWTKITKGNQTVLFTGDQRASDEMLGAMLRYYGEAEFGCQILKLTHHGEVNYCPQLLAAATPRIAIFTGTPRLITQETEQLCLEMGVERYFLHDGDLTFTLDGNNITAKGIEPR